MSDEKPKEVQHVVQIYSRYAVLAPGPPPPELVDKFTAWDWDETTTGKLILEKAMDKLKRTPTDIEGAKFDGTPWNLYDKLDGTYLCNEYRQYPGYGSKDSYGPFADTLPRFRWIAIYAVEGDSEGHYIHMSLMVPEEGKNYLRESRIFHAKTFYGMKGALEVVDVLTRFFYFNQ